MEIQLAKLAEHVDGEVIGDKNCLINSVATLVHAKPGQISFFASNAYKQDLLTTHATAVIVTQAYVQDCSVTALVVKNPHVAYAKIAQLLNPAPAFSPFHHPSAVIDSSCRIHPDTIVGANAVIEAGATLEKGVYVGPNCTVGKNAFLAEDVRLVANVTICHAVRIGKRTLIHPGVVIGADGFGQALDNGRWIKIPQLGTVVIGEDVEIGACTSIDRGAIDDTIIGDGVKLDNQIQIAHNVHVGDHTVMAAKVGIAGSTHVGKHCLIGGMVGIAGHLRIVDRVIITGMSFIAKDIDQPGSYSSGIPSEETYHWHRICVHIKQLDELVQRVRKLEKQLTSK